MNFLLILLEKTFSKSCFNSETDCRPTRRCNIDDSGHSKQREAAVTSWSLRRSAGKEWPVWLCRKWGVAQGECRDSSTVPHSGTEVLQCSSANSAVKQFAYLKHSMSIYIIHYSLFSSTFPPILRFSSSLRKKQDLLLSLTDAKHPPPFFFHPMWESSICIFFCFPKWNTCTAWAKHKQLWHIHLL